MLLSTLCGNLLTCITSGCNDVEMGISAILSGFMGLFLQDIVTNYKNLDDKWGVFASYMYERKNNIKKRTKELFAILSLYLTISMFPCNGNVIGNIGGIFGGFSYPYIFKKASFSGEENTLKIAFSVVTILLLVSALAGVLFLKFHVSIYILTYVHKASQKGDVLTVCAGGNDEHPSAHFSRMLKRGVRALV
ncbi:rhomboid family protein [Plasmodium ovale curtisi]|uniref:Rhomboid family protein n=1 Tax=Plasmodium ovale curtisi TaxID=864141 RepID=A0A1A8WNN6_PLAOA|nr:rhomboid family protein [Plasmodium ovale curtisi]